MPGGPPTGLTWPPLMRPAFTLGILRLCRIPVVIGNGPDDDTVGLMDDVTDADADVAVGKDNGDQTTVPPLVTG